MKLKILLTFQNEVSYIFKMAGSQNLDFRIAKLSYFISNFDRVGGRLHSLLRACITDHLLSTLPSNLIYQTYSIFEWFPLLPEYTIGPDKEI